MFTAPAVNMEFETSEKKIEQLAPGCVAMSAGNSAYATEIISGTLVGLAGAQQPLVSAVADRLKDAYLAVRLTKIRDHIIVPNMGPDFLRVEAIGRHNNVLAVITDDSNTNCHLALHTSVAPRRFSTTASETTKWPLLPKRVGPFGGNS
jgi:hypothetical protein